MRLAYGIIGLLFAINAAYAMVVTSELIAGGGWSDVGILATVVVPPCIMAVVSIFCLRRAFKSANR